MLVIRRVMTHMPVNAPSTQYALNKFHLYTYARVCGPCPCSKCSWYSSSTFSLYLCPMTVSSHLPSVCQCGRLPSRVCAASHRPHASRCPPVLGLPARPAHLHASTHRLSGRSRGSAVTPILLSLFLPLPFSCLLFCSVLSRCHMGLIAAPGYRLDGFAPPADVSCVILHFPAVPLRYSCLPLSSVARLVMLGHLSVSLFSSF